MRLARVSLAGIAADAEHHLIAFAPLGDHLGQDLGRVLHVDVHRHYGAGRAHGRDRRRSPLPCRSCATARWPGRVDRAGARRLSRRWSRRCCRRRRTGFPSRPCARSLRALLPDALDEGQDCVFFVLHGNYDGNQWGFAARSLLRCEQLRVCGRLALGVGGEFARLVRHPRSSRCPNARGEWFTRPLPLEVFVTPAAVGLRGI